MGLLDDLLGGALGKAVPQGNFSKPLILAVLALLASGALTRKGSTEAGGGRPDPAAPGNNPLGDLLGGLLGGGQAGGGRQPAPGPANNPLGDLLGGLLGSGSAGQPGQAAPASSGNPLGDLLGSVLGGGRGPAGGALAGGLLGGLGNVLGQLQQGGQREAVDSWIGTGQNRQISAGELRGAFSPKVIQELSAETGLSPDDVLAQISEGLPDLVDQLTPGGQLPSASGDPALDELSRLSQQLR